MLVSYTGWGYREYEVDTDAINYTPEEISNGRNLLDSTCGHYLHAENIIFELPKPAQRDFALLGKTTVEYLLFSKFTCFEELDLRFTLPAKDDGKFWLCENIAIYNEYGKAVHRERKKVTYKLEDVARSENVLINQKQTDSLKPIVSIADQQLTETVDVAVGTQNQDKGPRIRQRALLLSVIDEMQIERFNIPIGGKQEVLKKCLKQQSVFSSKSVFNKVWSELSVSEEIAIEGKEKFL